MKVFFDDATDSNKSVRDAHKMQTFYPYSIHLCAISSLVSQEARCKYTSIKIFMDTHTHIYL